MWDAALGEWPAKGQIAHAILASLSGRAAVRRGDLDAAATRLGEVEGWLANHAAPYAAAFADQLRAELALAQGRTAEGAERAARALSAFAALPAPPDRALAALDFARVALEGRGQTRAPVGDWLDQAAGTFERLGDHHHRERALALMVRWLRRSALQPTVVTPERNLIEAVSRLLNSLSDLRELSQRAMRMAVEQLDAERGVLLLADPVSGQLVPIAEDGAIDATARNDAMGYSRRVVRRVTEGGGALLIGDAPSDPRALSESMVDMRLRSIVCVPMFLGGKVVGAVYLDDSRRPDVFSDADRGLLEGFAQLMAVAIENSRAQEEVQRANEALVGENLSLRQEIGARFQTHSIIGTSAVMQRVMGMAGRAAMTNTTVLLTGENGTGKELLARVIHYSGKRGPGPFVGVNCGAIPETLLESELFGILPNVATGVRARDGRFVQASGGTLFLDEIGEMPLKQQVALLSAIANREITPVGGGRPIRVDVRIMAATNRDLVRAVESGSFREDLYYRLNVIQIEVPPLRERKADIPALAQYFVARFAEQQERA
ncbi:MAG TPA: sigma 54-interacting transcriptional regulator, partial [Candidatus Eisenbacteria bacterium]